jgi:hypothetical protein
MGNLRHRFLFFCFLVVLGFELRALHLLSRFYHLSHEHNPLPFLAVVETEPRAFCVTSRHSTTDLYTSPKTETWKEDVTFSVLQ